MDRSIAARKTCRATGKAAASISAVCIRESMPKIGELETLVVMHNDAVVQGLSELPYVQDASIGAC